MRINDRTIKSAANTAPSLSALLWMAGYSDRSAGSNTMRRLKRVLGSRVYNEITSHRRYSLPKSKWTKVAINNRKNS